MPERSRMHQLTTTASAVYWGRLQWSAISQPPHDAALRSGAPLISRLPSASWYISTSGQVWPHSRWPAWYIESQPHHWHGPPGTSSNIPHRVQRQMNSCSWLMQRVTGASSG